MSEYFKQYCDEDYPNTAVSQLNNDIKNKADKLISVKYQVVRYETINKDRTYILAKWQA